MRNLVFRDVNICIFWQPAHIHSGQKGQFHGLTQVNLIRKVSERQNCHPQLLSPTRICWNFTMDNTCQSQANNQYYIRWRWLWVFPPPVLGLRTPSEAENPGSNMVKFLLIVLALGVSCAHHENLDISPSEVCAFGEKRVCRVSIHSEVASSIFNICYKIYIHTISESYL